MIAIEAEHGAAPEETEQRERASSEDKQGPFVSMKKWQGWLIIENAYIQKYENVQIRKNTNI